ncbi:hypothetical protein MIR68_009056 [Amoeboaphelidium protococcarum]|nr:hypothetical protein MIR68_009056 [Amoeboaphelidium protococcarum]
MVYLKWLLLMVITNALQLSAGKVRVSLTMKGGCPFYALAAQSCYTVTQSVNCLLPLFHVDSTTVDDDRHIYNQIIANNTGSFLYGDGVNITKWREIIDMHLSVKYDLVSILAQYQYYSDTLQQAIQKEQCQLEFIKLGGDIFCSIKEFESDLQSQNVTIGGARQQQSMSMASDAESKLGLVIGNGLPSFILNSLPINVVIYSQKPGQLFQQFMTKYGGKVKFIFMWIPPSSQASSSSVALREYSTLSGYGIELAVKSTEYKAKDDQKYQDEDSEVQSQQATNMTLNDNLDFETFNALYHRYDYNESQLNYVNQLLVDQLNQNSIYQLSQDDKKKTLPDMGYRLASWFMDLPFSVHTAQKILCKFPSFYAQALNQSVNAKLRSEINVNKRYFNQVPGRGQQIMLINGLVVDLSDIDVFTLSDIMRVEFWLSNFIKNLNISFDGNNTMQDLISSISGQSGKSGSGGQQDGRQEVYDMRMKFERPGQRQKKSDISPVVWWNDIEKDGRYKQYPTSLQGLFQIQRAGQLPMIRKNIVNVVIATSLSSKVGLNALQQYLDFIAKSYPIRVGFLPIKINGELDGHLIKVFFVLLDNYGKKAASNFISQLAEHLATSAGPMSEDVAHQKYNAIIKTYKIISKSKSFSKDDQPYQELTFDEVISYTEDRLNKFQSLVDQKQKDLFLFPFTAGDKVMTDMDGDNQSYNGALFINGAYHELDDNHAQYLGQTITQQIQYLQQAAYYGKVNDQTNVYHHLLQIQKAKSRRNPYLQDEYVKILDLTSSVFQQSDLLQRVSYSYGECSKSCSITLWIHAADDKESILNEIENFYESSSKEIRDSVRIAFIASDARDSKTYSNGELLKLVLQQVPIQNDIEQIGSFVVINGKLIGPFQRGYFLSGDDLTELCTGEFEAFRPLRLIINQELTDNDDNAQDQQKEGVLNPGDQLLLAYNAVMNAAMKHLQLGGGFLPFGSTLKDVQRISIASNLKNKYSMVHLGSDDAYIQIIGVVDPSLPSAQRALSILTELSHLNSLIQLQVYWNPSEVVGDKMPIDRYYQLNYQTLVTFQEDGLLDQPQTSLDHIPLEPLFTLATEIPQAWVVMQKKSVFDLDNIRMAEVKSSKGLYAELALVNILIEGHARDVKLGTAPRGLQFTLGRLNTDAITTDTIVMANLGYYQLQANPGVWQLKIRDGRSQEFYDLISVQDGRHGVNRVDANGSLQIYLTKFTGSLLLTKVGKKAGKLDEDLLTENAQDAASREKKSWSEWLGLSKQFSDYKHGQINIFSVASGHLYERFLRIMIISVLRHTKSDVKFWFIENFLSPQFKDFLPAMAEKYQFKYQLVTYKWPQWLRHQTEKQRIIWAYKILFLDVLFPLDLNKIIFVDADQIVRADMKELIDMELKDGAPYAYTPFCDDRSDIENFRFWKKGYWKEHLQGKSYHISALYVVDLNRFRMIAAGDRLRQHYQMVTSDPNSLANLDQDLPNDAQHAIPIHSLPQEWLWCQTWCSDESLTRAKTIDLCNNPMTKEPKLERAQRLIPEWKEYDSEARNLFEEWRQSMNKSKEFKGAATDSNSAERTMIKDEF